MNKNLLKLFFYKIRFWFLSLTFLSVGIEAITFGFKSENNRFYSLGFDDISVPDLYVCNRALPILSILFTITIAFLLFNYVNHKSETDLLISAPYKTKDFYLSAMIVSLFSVIIFIFINYIFILTVTLIKKKDFAIITDNLSICFRFYLGTLAAAVLVLGMILFMICISETIRGAIGKFLTLNIASFLIYFGFELILEQKCAHYAAMYSGGIFNVKYNILLNCINLNNVNFMWTLINLKGIVSTFVIALIFMILGFSIYLNKFSAVRNYKIADLFNNLLKYIGIIAFLSIINLLVVSGSDYETRGLFISILLIIIVLTIILARHYNNFIYSKNVRKKTLMDIGISVVIFFIIHFGLSGYIKLYEHYTPKADSLKYITLHEGDDELFISPVSCTVSNTKITDKDMIKGIVANINKANNHSLYTENSTTITCEFNNGLFSTYREYELSSYYINKLEKEILETTDQKIQALPEYDSNAIVAYYELNKNGYINVNATLKSSGLKNIYKKYVEEFKSLDKNTQISILQGDLQIKSYPDLIGHLKFINRTENGVYEYELPVYSKTPETSSMIKSMLDD